MGPDVLTSPHPALLRFSHPSTSAAGRRPPEFISKIPGCSEPVPLGYLGGQQGSPHWPTQQQQQQLPRPSLPQRQSPTPARQPALQRSDGIVQVARHGSITITERDTPSRRRLDKQTVLSAGATVGKRFRPRNTARHGRLERMLGWRHL